MDRVDFILTPNCNAACRYCFQRQTYGALGAVRASRAVIDDFVRFCGEQALARVDVFGGEPLLHQDEFVHLVRALRHALPEAMLGTVTNGTLLTAALFEALRAHQVGLLLSLDGRKERHDAYRGGFDAIQPWIPDLVAHGTEVAMQLSRAAGTYENVKYLWDLGFTGGVFINVIEIPGWYEPGEAVVFAEEYEQAVLGMLRGEGTLSCAVRAFRALSAFEVSPGCGITGTAVTCDWRGGLYPCHRAMELGEAFRIGDIYAGIDAERERMVRGRILEEAFVRSESARAHPLVSLCPVSVYQHHQRFDAEWPPEYVRMVETKAVVVAKHHYALAAFLERSTPSPPPEALDGAPLTA